MSSHNICFYGEIRKILSGYPSYLDIWLDPEQGPGVQSIVSLTSSLMTNLLTVVAKVFSNTLIFLLPKFEVLLQYKDYSHIFSKNINALVVFQDRNFDVILAKNFV